jgi:hypothetical protein
MQRCRARLLRLQLLCARCFFSSGPTSCRAKPSWAQNPSDGLAHTVLVQVSLPVCPEAWLTCSFDKLAWPFAAAVAPSNAQRQKETATKTLPSGQSASPDGCSPLQFAKTTPRILRCYRLPVFSLGNGQNLHFIHRPLRRQT